MSDEPVDEVDDIGDVGCATPDVLIVVGAVFIVIALTVFGVVWFIHSVRLW